MYVEHLYKQLFYLCRHEIIIETILHLYNEQTMDCYLPEIVQTILEKNKI